MSNKIIRKLFGKIFTSKDPIIVIPFGGYANNTTLHAQARVLEDEDITHKETDGFFRNLLNSYKRFESDEIRNARVDVIIGNKNVSFISDEEGYIYINKKYEGIFKNDKTNWIPITYKLKLPNNPIFETTDYLLKPSSKSSFGVISDLDDTVIETGVASFFKWRLIVNSVFKNSDKRHPLEGVQAFYQQLYDGKKGNEENPFFYLSNSPWNIYNYLQRFLRKNNFPKGALLLRDMGFENTPKKSFLEGNKFVKIKLILETYPKMKFILIGDAADIDAEIYIEIARKFKDQVLSIYIRTVSNKRKIRKVERIIEATTDVKVVLIENTAKATIHAKNQGYIN